MGSPESPAVDAKTIAAERVLVLDFGAQYVQLIARRVREQHVYCEIARHDISADRVRALAAVQHRTLPVFGLQFHPEVTHTSFGREVLGNFLLRICGCHGTWRLGDFARETIEAVRQRVGKYRVICGLSGGVDSSVVAALL